MSLFKIEEINKIITSISFIDVIEKFQQIDFFLEGKIALKDIKGLNNSLCFDVRISPQYPLKSHGTEAIMFINKDLIPYDHVMEDGSICIHTIHSPKLKQKLLADFESIKSWVYKYYVSKDKDMNYEHIIINEQPFDDIYYSYQFTDVDHSFKKGEFGKVDLIFLSSGIYKKKSIANFLLKSFQPFKKPITINSKWSDYYMNFETSNTGLFTFIEDVPASYNRFAFSNWLQLERYIPIAFLEFLYGFQKRNYKPKKPLVPIFFGYKTVENEIHWISTLVNLNEMPTIGVPVVDLNGSKLKGQWKSKLIDQKINWCITRNSSYKYLFGRGTFCDKITDAKILIIGVGAIGSIVAKTLVKCGAKNISIVDYDIKEPENACRSEYNFSNGLYDKTSELINTLYENSPFVNIDFYNNNELFEVYIKVSHKNKEAIKKYEESLNQFDIVFNCSTDSDLMFVLNQLKLITDLINLSITNHAKDLVCAFYPNIYKYVQNQFTNILNNDVEDLYYPTGCWSPTFKASYNDISLLVQYALKEINVKYQESKPKDNFTLSMNSDKNTNIKFTQY